MFRAQNYKITPVAGGTFGVVDTSGVVHIVNTSGTVTNTITFGISGYGGAYGNGKIMLSGYSATGTVEVRNATTGSYIGSVAVGSYPFGIEYYNNKFWVACGQSDEIYVINDTTLAVDTIVSSTYPQGISGANSKIAATEYNNTSSSVSIFNASSYASVTTVSAGSYGSAIGTGNGKWCATNYLDSTVTIIDTSSYSVLATVGVGTNPYGSRVGYDNNYFAVGSYTSVDVTFINATTNAVASTLATGGGSIWSTAGGGGFFIATDETNAQCFIIDSTTLAIVHTVSLAASGSVDAFFIN